MTPRTIRTPNVTFEAFMLHGADDGCIGGELAPSMREFFPRGLQIEIIPGAGHFVHQEKPELVNRLVQGFLRR